VSVANKHPYIERDSPESRNLNRVLLDCDNIVLLQHRDRAYIYRMS
jgi:hypothetical protein